MSKKKMESALADGGAGESGKNLLFEAVDERISRAAPAFDAVFEEALSRRPDISGPSGRAKKVLRFPVSVRNEGPREGRPRFAAIRWGGAAAVFLLTAAALLLQYLPAGETAPAAALKGDTAAFVDSLYGGGIFAGSDSMSSLYEGGDGMFGSSEYVQEVITLMFELEPLRFGTGADGS